VQIEANAAVVGDARRFHRSPATELEGLLEAKLEDRSFRIEVQRTAEGDAEVEQMDIGVEQPVLGKATHRWIAWWPRSGTFPPCLVQLAQAVDLCARGSRELVDDLLRRPVGTGRDATGGQLVNALLVGRPTRRWFGLGKAFEAALATGDVRSELAHVPVTARRRQRPLLGLDLPQELAGRRPQFLQPFHQPLSHCGEA
jgi:hypothetical protein